MTTLIKATLSIDAKDGGPSLAGCGREVDMAIATRST
jgi:hypothetical protein